MIHSTALVETKQIGKGTKIWQFVIVFKGAVIGKNCNICAHCLIENDVILGDNVTVKSGVYLWDGLQLEDNVFVGPNVSFTNDKYPKSKNKDFILERTFVREGASIGASAIILPGLVIGKNSLVGAGSLVSKNVPTNGIVVGNPAVIVGWRNEDGSKMKFKNGYYIDSKGNKWEERNRELIKI